jgi:hypothetical protein
MEYVYMQQIKPNNATGVPVKLSVVDPNGNTVDIGSVTSDIDGMYALAYTPRDQGLYKVIATFEGSESYFGSSGTTYFNLGPAAPAPSVTGVPTPTPPPTTVTPTPTEPVTPSPSQPVGPSGGENTTMYVAISAVVIIAVIAAAALVLRRRK